MSNSKSLKYTDYIQFNETEQDSIIGFSVVSPEHIGTKPPPVNHARQSQLIVYGIGLCRVSMKNCQSTYQFIDTMRKILSTKSDWAIGLLQVSLYQPQLMLHHLLYSGL